MTFRLADALPQRQLQLLKRMWADWERTHPHSRSEQEWESYARQYATRVERWLDEGYGACYLGERRWFEDMRDRLLHFQEERYFLSCWTIMPNHCHLIIRPYDGYALEDLVGAMKGVTARHINSLLGASGTVWEEECYDRIVRDEEHLWRAIQYIRRNPRFAGFADETSWRTWIHPQWKAAGWGFRDETN